MGEIGDRLRGGGRRPGAFVGVLPIVLGYPVGRVFGRFGRRRLVQLALLRRLVQGIGGILGRAVPAAGGKGEEGDQGRGVFHPEGTMRSQARRAGKEFVSTCRTRWSPYH